MSANAYREPAAIGPELVSGPPTKQLQEQKFFGWGSGQPAKMTLAELLKSNDRDALLTFKGNGVRVQLKGHWYEFVNFAHLVDTVTLGIRKDLTIEEAMKAALYQNDTRNKNYPYGHMP